MPLLTHRKGAIMALGASESRAVVENGNVVVREIVTGDVVMRSPSY